MWPCSKARKPAAAEEEPLLPQHEDPNSNTYLQQQLRVKLHNYAIIRALRNGYLPSTNQLVAHLRLFLISDFLNPDNPTLSSAGRQLARDCKTWIRALITVLLDKNGENQLQDIIWYFSKSRVSVDTDDLAGRACQSTAQADTAAGI